jgi:hypothetical protein
MCGVARRAGGRLRAPLCAGFADGADNTNACPPGFSKMVSEAACGSAAALLGRPYRGTETFDSFPSGCYYLGGFGSLVFFNLHPTGAPSANVKPQCAGAAAKPHPSA